MTSPLSRATADVVIALFVIVTALLVAGPSSYELLHDPDIGSQLTKGFAILHGRHPFVEVDSSVYGPAIFYLSALAQAIDGERVLAEITLIFAGFVLAYGLLFWTLHERTRSRWLYWLFVAGCALMLPRFHKYHVVLSPALFLVCLHMASSPRRSSITAGAWLGAGCALAGLLRLDFGAYGVIAALSFLGLESRRRPDLHLGPAVAAMFGAGALLSAPWFTYVITSVGLSELIARFTDTTLGVYSGLTRDLPALSEAAATPHAMALVMGYWSLKLTPFVTAALTAVQWRDNGRPMTGAVDGANASPFIAAASVAAALFYLQASHRIDVAHIQQVWPPVALIAVLAMSSALANRRFVFFAATTLLLVGGTVTFLRDTQILRGHGNVAGRLGTVSGSWLLSKSEIIAGASAADDSATRALPYAISRVRALTAPAEAVLFLPYAGQSYYFSDRLFDTPFGWLNPGRFRSEGSEQRFIDSMGTTAMIVDNPSFSFDGMVERNMRYYARHLTEFIYTHYGIFDVAAPLVLLAKSPAILERSGVYRFRLIPGVRPTSHQAPVKIIDTLNTLPMNAPAVTLQVPRGGGLLFGFAGASSLAADGECTGLALQHERGDTYVVSDTNGTPVRFTEIGAYDLIDTRLMADGPYDAVLVRSNVCTALIDDDAAISVAAAPTGVRIELGPAGNTGTKMPQR